MKYNSKLNRKNKRAKVDPEIRSLVKNRNNNKSITGILDKEAQYNLSNKEIEFLTNLKYFKKDKLSHKQSEWLSDIKKRK